MGGRDGPSGDVKVADAARRDAAIGDAVGPPDRPFDAGVRAGRIMHVDSPAAAGDFVPENPGGEDILLGQHVISENPPGLPHAELFGGRGNIGVFKARHMFLQELQNPERLPGPLPPDAHLIGGIQGIAVRNVGHVDDPVDAIRCVPACT